MFFELLNINNIIITKSLELFSNIRDCNIIAQLEILYEIKEEYIKLVKDTKDDIINKEISDIFNKFDNKVVENSFLSKLVDMTPFKGGLPKNPIVVGLIYKVPNGVNNIISKFIGYQSKPIKELNAILEEIKDDIGECRPGSDIPKLCVRIHINDNMMKTRKRNGSIDDCFINELKDSNITKEKIEILKLRFFRLPEKYKFWIMELTRGNLRKKLGI